MTILQILDELAATSSTLGKEAILKREKDNMLLKQVFQAAYNPMITYGIKAIPEYDNEPTSDLPWALTFIEKLQRREVTGNDAVALLRNVLTYCTEPVVVERIILRDLRCGTSDTLASRVWPGLVPTFDVMLCDKDMSRIKYPAYAQTKCDGARVHLYFDGTTVKAMSRSGKEFQLRGSLDKTAAPIMAKGDCWDGELLVVQNGKIAPREIGNGILNKANKGTITQAEADMIVAVVWDIVDFTGTIPYTVRFSTLLSRLGNKINDRISAVTSVVVADENEAMQFFAEQLSQGQEGAIIKNMNHLWVPKRSKDLCKLKEINTADLVVVDIVEGTGKYVGMVGALVCETSDSLLRVNVGTGLSDEQRKEMWINQSLIGSVVEVTYNQKITSKGKDKASLFLPRLAVVRFDKTTANTLAELA